MISTWRGDETRTAIGSHETSKGIRLAHERTALALFTGKLSFGFAVHFGTLTHGAMVRQSGRIMSCRIRIQPERGSARTLWRTTKSSIAFHVRFE